MKVVICEDDERQRLLMVEILTQHALMHQPSIEIVKTASSAEEVLSFLDHTAVDCYFLDIELAGELTGVQLATEIRQRDPFATIIFVTTYADQLQLTFKYKLAALDFIVKAHGETFLTELKTALDAAYEKYVQLGNGSQKFHFQVKMGEFIHNIRFDEIYYFATALQPHKVTLHSKNGYYEFYGKLNDIENLDDRFYRCHKSCLINLQHIQSIDKKHRKVTMQNGEVCPLSIRALATIHRKMDYF